MSLTINDLRLKKKIIYKGKPFEVIWVQHSKKSRAGAVMRTKLMDLTSGAVLEATFQGADKFEEADLTTTKAQFLYQEGENYFFMDQENFDQFSLSRERLGEAAGYLAPETMVDILNFEGKPINVELPIKVVLKVKKAPPGMKGDTAQGATKTVTLETGKNIDVPLFVNEGDCVKIDTRDGKYLERVKK